MAQYRRIIGVTYLDLKPEALELLDSLHLVGSDEGDGDSALGVSSTAPDTVEVALLRCVCV